jgi:hypothetical protein
MKLKQIVAVTASAIAVCAAGSASAAYMDPLNIPAGAITIKLGGATAQDKGLALLMRRICTIGTMTQVSGSKQTAYLCEANGTDSNVAPYNITLGTPLVLYKNSVSGSGSGVVPVSDATVIPFLDLTTLTAADYGNANTATAGAKCSTSITAATVDFADVAVYNCGTNIGSVNSAPDAGISDVEPALLGWSGVNGALTVTAGPQVIFGVPVSNSFRDALQAAQGKTVGSTAEADMPSLTKAQLAAMMTGGIINMPNTLSDINGNKLVAPAGGATVTFCRRKTGSGTLASTKAYFTGEGCAANVKQMSGGVDGDLVAPTLSSRVMEYGGTTGVLGCLNAAHTANKWAIGMASTETKPGFAYTGDAIWGTDAGNWSFVKIQGYAPTSLNVVGTKYDFVMEATYQYRAAGNTFGAALVAPQKNFADLIIATNGNPLVMKELNAQFVQPFGQAGLLGKPGTPTLPSALPAGILTQAEVTANPVNTWTRAALGAPNSCQPAAILTKETGLNMLQ